MTTAALTSHPDPRSWWRFGKHPRHALNTWAIRHMLFSAPRAAREDILGLDFNCEAAF